MQEEWFLLVIFKLLWNCRIQSRGIMEEWAALTLSRAVLFSLSHDWEFHMNLGWTHTPRRVLCWCPEFEGTLVRAEDIDWSHADSCSAVWFGVVAWLGQLWLYVYKTNSKVRLVASGSWLQNYTTRCPVQLTEPFRIWFLICKLEIIIIIVSSRVVNTVLAWSMYWVLALSSFI